MGSVIYLVASTILNLLLTLLPLSPFASLQLPEGVDLAIGWLNWVVDIDACIRLMAAWIACALVAAVVGIVRDNLDVFIGKGLGD